MPVPPDARDVMTASLNRLRASHGLVALQRDEVLDRVAQARVGYVADYYARTGILAHDDPTVTNDRYFEVLPLFGITWFNWAGENLAMNNYSAETSVERAMTSLYNSPTHRDNTLAEEFASLGVGYLYQPASRRHFYAQVFLG